MDAILTAAMTKAAGSAFSTSVGGRIYEGNIPEGSPDFPCSVLRVQLDNTEYPGGKVMESWTLEVSIFSTSRGVTEIGGIFQSVQALYDDCSLTITGKTLVYCIRRGAIAEKEPGPVVVDGTTGLRRWAQEYELLTVY